MANMPPMPGGQQKPKPDTTRKTFRPTPPPGRPCPMPGSRG